MNTYAKIATLSDIRDSITGHANPIPTRTLALRAAEVVRDEQFNGFLYPLAAGHRLRAAILWGRIGDLVTGQSRVDAYALAAVLAHDSGNLPLAANYVIRLQQLARAERLDIPPVVEELKRQHAFREILVRAHPGGGQVQQ
ncbi:hypothetical protein [Mycobacterium avium]|uniref:hypothetical protein n=1 Tax=Mycobacterium avium TaxID=1764 RepID=UPI000B4AC4FE|nr:hypothetical protein [Mycobacterium avium]